MKLPGIFSILLSAILFLSFIFLSKYEDRQLVRTIDFAATVKVQNAIDNSVHLRLAALVDNAMVGSSFFAGPAFSSFVVILLTVIGIRKKEWRSLMIPAAFVALVVLELVGKTIVHHPSPPFAMIKHATSVFPDSYVNEQFSYPSGHAARAVFLAVILLLTIKQYNNKTMKKSIWLLIGLGVYIGLVSISRIYLGHHWLSDVVGGLLLGGSLGLLTKDLNSPIMNKQ